MPQQKPKYSPGQALPLPEPAILRKAQAAQYLGMSIDMFEKNIADGIIEPGAKLRPMDEKSVILGWSLQKLERARANIDGEEKYEHSGQEDLAFEQALESFGAVDL